MLSDGRQRAVMCLLVLSVLELTMSSPTTKRVLLDLSADTGVDVDSLESQKEALEESSNFAEPVNRLEIRPETVKLVKAWREGKKVAHDRRHRRLMDRGRKIKFLKRDREQDDATNTYVLDEAVTGYAPLPRPTEDVLEGQTMGFLHPGDDLLYVRHRLQKLDYYFEFMKIMSEDCRQRMLCEVAREPSRFYPLSSVLEDVTSFIGGGSYQYATSQLINTTEGARLLSYMEASFRGQDRSRTCAVFQYRCPSPTEHMINYEALCLWREMVRWLTIHVVAKSP